MWGKIMWMVLVSIICVFSIGLYGINCFIERDKRNKSKIEQQGRLIQLLLSWVDVKKDGFMLSDFLLDKGYRNIAIYGMGNLGTRLYNELKTSDVSVAYAIDKHAGDLDFEIEVKSLEENLPDVDVIVITPIYHISDIKKDLEKKTTAELVSIEDIVYGLL